MINIRSTRLCAGHRVINVSPLVLTRRKGTGSTFSDVTLHAFIRAWHSTDNVKALRICAGCRIMAMSFGCRVMGRRSGVGGVRREGGQETGNKTHTHIPHTETHTHTHTD
ncbi:hypothetical protein FKM82_018537 [Ascaphus truei]